ncbi:hypothetical protein [Winogradskyella aurantiaca]|uniref:hypothetical protein n=1 Tax=Winogradskyella aurantiaca TaxID=2219558 RepID=UPI000E1D44A9|nr:hypothetical protein [Winogradskyella aurantiaca]
MAKPPINQILSRVKKIVLTALLFITFGTVLELYLLDHYEDTKQLIPIICIGAMLLLMMVLAFRPSNVISKLFQFMLLITAFSGIYGTYLHLMANYEFELEMTPSASGWTLFKESLSGALPALAPGSMVILALIGYVYITLLKQQ